MMTSSRSNIVTQICNRVAGTDCQTEINECESSPCRNAATCNNHVNSFTCTCVAGFEGLLPILQRVSTIVNQLMVNHCVTSPGRICDYNIDECDSDPCQHGATCRDEVNSYICECAPGYTGACRDLPSPTDFMVDDIKVLKSDMLQERTVKRTLTSASRRRAATEAPATTPSTTTPAPVWMATRVSHNSQLEPSTEVPWN